MIDFKTFRPNEVATYLRSTGWKRIDEIGTKGSIWSLSNEKGESAEVLLPEDRELRDYTNRMAELLEIIQIVEQRPKTSIIKDLVTHRSDILRFRIASSETSSGTLPLTQATSLAKGVENLLLSAACATNQPRSYFPRMNISDAKDYLKKCRMDQTERGSYVFTVLSPVPPALTAQNSLLPEYEVEEAFERKVLHTLFNGLYYLQRALVEGTNDAIDHAIEKGVSANFCDALSLMQPEDESGELDIGVSWSQIRPVTVKPPIHRIKFSSDLFPLLGESSRYLKRIAPIDDYELRGTVRKLEWTNPQSNGKVTIQTIIDDRSASVTIELSPKHYQIAVQAHKDYLPIYCKGELVKEGKYYRLLNSRELQIEQVDDI